MSKSDHLAQLAELCRDLGGRLELVTWQGFDRVFDSKASDGEVVTLAPFTSAHGLNWDRKIVYAVREHAQVGAIIHEMGHAFASTVHPEHAKCEEWDFFGWEIAVARRIGAMAVWSYSNSGYVVDLDSRPDWGELSRAARARVTAERIDMAQALGSLDQHLAPRSLR